MNPLLSRLAAAAIAFSVGCPGGSRALANPHPPVTNLASAQAGAVVTAGPHTEFLGDEDLRGFAQGRPVIFRHGPRGLEKVLLVRLAAPASIATVSFGTGIDDWIRVPTGVDVSASLTGEPGSYAPIGSAAAVRAPRAAIAIDPPVHAQWLRFAFRDTSGGSRITELGAFAEPAAAVMDALGGFDPPTGAQAGRLTEAGARALVARYGPRGGMDITLNCSGLDYAAPPDDGPGTLLDRAMAEDTHIRRALEAARRDLPVYRALGVTAIETYVRWNLIEEREGVFDFSIYDAFADAFERSGLRWVPLVIAGPAHALPRWFRTAPDYVPFRCLEHDRDNAVVSVFSPGYRTRVERFLRAFARHYRARRSVQAVMLGVSGIFGETQYPHDSTRDWTTTATGDYHSHFGWWVGDGYARADWRRFLARRYTSDTALAKAWGAQGASIREQQPRQPSTMPSPRARMDFLEWTTGAMTHTAGLWIDVLRREMPGAPLLLSVGGHGIPRIGTDFQGVARLCGRTRAGIRITNEGTDYRENVAMTRWIATACGLYGAWLGIEPASVQIDRGTAVHRAYNAAASGARELFCYPSDLRNQPGYEALASAMPHLQPAVPRRRAAYWVPRTHLMCEGDTDYIRQMMSLRTLTDFDAVDGAMASDGALRHIRVLVMGAGFVEEDRSLRAIERWLLRGGVIVRVGAAPLTTVEGSTAWDARLLGGAHGAGVGIRALQRPGETFASAVARAMEPLRASRPDLLDPTTTGLPDGVYGTRTDRGLLFLNLSDRAVTLPGPLTVPPNAIGRLAVPQRLHAPPAARLLDGGDLTLPPRVVRDGILADPALVGRVGGALVPRVARDAVAPRGVVQ